MELSPDSGYPVSVTNDTNHYFHFQSCSGYFPRQKFSFQTHMDGTKNRRRKPVPEKWSRFIWHRFLERVSWASDCSGTGHWAATARREVRHNAAAAGRRPGTYGT